MAAKGFIELLRLADLAKARQSGRHRQNKAQWVGVSFQIAQQQLIAPMGEISEVLAMPLAVTPVPLTKPWMVGVANVRGRLLSLIDLSSFLGMDGTAQISQRKVMVIEHANMLSGLLVDQVLGIEQFNLDDYVAESLADESPFLPYNHGKFSKDQQTWAVFMPSLLVQDARYLKAAM